MRVRSPDLPYCSLRGPSGLPLTAVYRPQALALGRRKDAISFAFRYGFPIQPGAECRYCSVWAAQPGNLEEWRHWPQEVRDGQHNPKVCPRAIAQLLKAGNPGASFLKERWGKNKAARPEGNQRRTGQ